MDQASTLRGLVNNRRSSEDIRDDRIIDKSHIRVISVTSGKGGVGKSNVVANLAFAFQKMGTRVLVFDADLGLANMDILLGLNPRYTINNVLSGEKNLEDITGMLLIGFRDRRHGRFR